MWRSQFIDLFKFETHPSSGHPKTQTMQTADCRLQTVQTVQTVQTEYFFLTLDSLFSVLQLQNSVKYVVMFIIYPQIAKTRHLTVDSIDKGVFNTEGEIPLLILNVLI